MKQFLRVFIMAVALVWGWHAAAQNIALGKNVTASSVEHPVNTPAHQVNDNNTATTRWASAPGNDDEWITIDLAWQYDITQVVLRWETAMALDYNIEVSNDGTTWTLAEAVTGNTNPVNTIPLTNANNYRYIRMQGLQRSDPGWGYSLWEFEVEGTPVGGAIGSNVAYSGDPLNLKPAVASSSLFTNASSAFDGQGNASTVDYLGGGTGTLWASDPGYAGDPEQWIYVDLGARYNLHQVVLYWYSDPGADFEIQTTNDPLGTWTTVASITDNRAYVNTFNVTGNKAQYVRLYTTAHNITGGQFQLFEFEVYGIEEVLPAVLTNLSAVKLGQSQVKIGWTTAQELNTQTFVVERSANGTSWQQVAALPAAGNSNTPLNYSVTDTDPVKGNNYYRLKTIDIDGHFEYSATRRVDFRSAITFTLYPNPAADELLITTDKVNGLNRASLQVLNNMSQVVINRSIADGGQPYRLNVASLQPGVYYLKLVTAEGEINMEKFIKR